MHLGGTLCVHPLSLDIARSASCDFCAVRVYSSTSSNDLWPVIDMISWGVAPRSAKRVANALRRPWAEQCGRFAWRHQSLKALPKPFAVNGFPYSVTKKVRWADGEEAIASANSGSRGISMSTGLRFRALDRAMAEVRLQRPQRPGGVSKVILDESPKTETEV